MAFTCNINSKGKRIRLVFGAILLIVGIAAMLLHARPAGSVWAWVVSGSVTAIGAFMLFEARAGWCALRAMGFKTPL